MRCLVISSKERGDGAEGQRTEMVVQPRSLLSFCVEDPRSCCLPRGEIEMMVGAERAGRMGAAMYSVPVDT